MLSPKFKQEIIEMVNEFDVDGDLCDYAYAAYELFEEIVEEFTFEENISE